MYPIEKHERDNTSTPKRRRLGMAKVLRSSQRQILKENNIFSPQCSPVNILPDYTLSSPARCDSPTDTQLPCNQVEFLSKSSNNNFSVEVPGSSTEINTTIVDSENWKSLEVSNIQLNNIQVVNKSLQKELAYEIEDISDDMFYSRLEQEKEVDNTIFTSKCEEQYMKNINQTFENINKSLNNIDVSTLFETKDSFLLDIKERDIVSEEKDRKTNELNEKSTAVKENAHNYSNNFYGLPIIVKGLFKSYRNIEKFYDWQEECLNLNAIHERRNLIYSLPTSGGKTLVAEVLMLREVLLRKSNALFVLPFVAIVQEKIWSLSPFALQMEFLVEEYAGGKGHIPPVKRRKKNSIYIATIEKGLALIRSLIELDRLHEIGLIVVDELHLIGEPGRGGTLETLLSTVIFANKGIQIVGMSATIGNLGEIAQFLNAEVYQREFRPVELTEYVKLGDTLHEIVRDGEKIEFVPQRELAYDYSAAAKALDPDWLGGLVAETGPQGSVLVFCPTKRNCENVAALLCKLQRREMLMHRTREREALQSALIAEGSSAELARAARSGVGYHHAGLTGDERALLEQAFRSGVISVLCCTSTLAAGVNLPAQRVIVRAPFVGRQPLSLAAYRQMAGRAGRAGHCASGESILMCGPGEWGRVRETLRGPVRGARSSLCARALLASGVALRLAASRRRLDRMLACTLLALQLRHSHGSSDVNLKTIRDDALRYLLENDVIEMTDKGQPGPNETPLTIQKEDSVLTVYEDSQLTISNLGRAAIKGCMDLSAARQILEELETWSRRISLRGPRPLHLLYLVSPRDAPAVPAADGRRYYRLYCNLDEDGVQTAKILGITERNAIRMMTGKPITNVPQMVLNRFYYAMMLRDLWNQMPVPVVAEKYGVTRGLAGGALAAAAAAASSAAKLAAELAALWPLAPPLAELAARLQASAEPHLAQLMELPAVKKARALQLVRAGYKRVEDLAKASAEELSARVALLPRTTAAHLISAARMMLIEKVENLRAEAEEVMEELNS